MEGRKLLPVEGKDDEKVILRLCESRYIEVPAIRTCRSDSELLRVMKVEARAAEQGGALGIVIDADAGTPSRRQSIRDRMTDCGYENVPARPEPYGTVLPAVVPNVSQASGNLPKFGVWLMPNNQDPGNLEVFLRFLVPQGDPHWQHAESCVDAMDNPLFKPVHRSEAVIHTWLAWQREPGRPFGAAITQKILDSGCVQARHFVQWLGRLYD